MTELEIIKALAIVASLFVIVFWLCLKGGEDSAADILARQEIRDINRG